MMELTVVLSTVIATAAAVYFWQSLTADEPLANCPEENTVLSLLFDDGVLHHATLPARQLLSMEPGTHYWQDLRLGLLKRFPDFPNEPREAAHGEETFFARDLHGPTQARIRWRGNLCWVSLLQQEEAWAQPSDPMIQAELRTLRRIAVSSPNPAWQETLDGKVSWYNSAYEALYRRAFGGAVNPARPLFGASAAELPDRISLSKGAGEKPDWYQLTSTPAEDLTICHATSIDAVVAAEDAQRNFVQTLAKTFAHLSIGLAIFDRDGQLTIFNPALVELTGLPAHFLSGRPGMLSFFDQLRENRRMPEPKNYRTWREEIAGVIAAATDGTYQETWTLESGQTYSVKGRPHPDGATVFLIEDISAEMTLTRNFRAELEQSQLLLDTVEEPMVVFSPTGVLTFSNAAYRKAWKVDPDASFADVLIRDCVKMWGQRFGSARTWKSVEEFVTDFGERHSWDVTIGHRQGTSTICYLMPLPSGSTMVQFRQRAATEASQPPELIEAAG